MPYTKPSTMGATPQPYITHFSDSLQRISRIYAHLSARTAILQAASFFDSILASFESAGT